MTPSDVKIVADNIEDFIEVPDGIDRLRRAVLTLAVSGKLVPQDISEGTAEDLYKQIQAERGKKVEGKKKKTKELPEITEEEIPFEIPKSWKWVRINDVADYLQRGKSPEYVDQSDYPVISQKCVRWGAFDWNPVRFISQESLSSYSSERFLQENDVLINSTGTGTVGRACIFTSNNKHTKVVADGHVTVARFSQITPNYVTNLLATDFVQSSLVNKTTGSTNQIEWSLTSIQNQLLPLPPSSEQKRIVQKVYELMDQIDDLELKKKERDETRIRLARSAMQSLGKGDSKIAFEQLIELIKTPNDIKELENALFTLAVSGQLVSQNKKDGTGEDLFKELQQKRQKIKKQILVEEKDEIFPIPSNWSWVRLEDVFDVRDGTHDSPKYHDSGYPLITSKNLYYGKLDFLNVKYVSETDYKKINERSKVDRDDILFAMIGSIGNPVIVDTGAKFSIKNVALFKYYSRELSEPNFLLTYLKYASHNMRAISAGGVQSFVSLGFLRGYPFPLAPLAEQKRIVEKLEEIMVLVDHLKQVINK